MLLRAFSQVPPHLVAIVKLLALPTVGPEETSLQFSLRTLIAHFSFYPLRLPPIFLLWKLSLLVPSPGTEFSAPPRSVLVSEGFPFFCLKTPRMTHMSLCLLPVVGDLFALSFLC